MPSSNRPRRSALYIPGSNQARLEKGRRFAADMLVMDLEDAVVPDEKKAAREKIKTVLSKGGFGGREILIRVNSLQTDWGEEDIRQMSTCGANGLVLPKVESAETIQKTAALMATSGAPAEMMIWCMMETPAGILRAEEIATASPKIAGLLMGTNDLAKDLCCLNTPGRLPMITSLGLCLLVARAHGLAILDGVYPNLRDDQGFARSCQQSLEMGFDGRTLIHPKDIALTNKIFAPSRADIEHASKVIEAFDKACADGLGAVTLENGELVERLHAEDARRLLDTAKMIDTLTQQINA